MIFNELNEDNFLLFAIKNYQNPQAVTREDFDRDLNHFKYIKRLLKRYKNVSITEINSEEDLEALVKRKPDLVFSGVKYFFFNNRNILYSDIINTDVILFPLLKKNEKYFIFRQIIKIR